MDDLEITPGSGNIYEDLGFPDAGEMLIKANLASIIQEIIKSKSLTQVKAAEITGLSQPKLSDLLKGKFRGISEAKMLECITRLGRDIRIEVAPHERVAGSPGQIEVCIGI